MKRLLFIALLIGFERVNAQTYVAIPDSNFVHYLKTIVPAAFKGDSLNTSSTLVTTTTHTINVQSLIISNLTGIQYFTSLTYLNCEGNALTTLPTLPNSLTYFNCQGNGLSNLSPLPNSLIYLNCSTQLLGLTPTLNSLPVLPNTLRYLNCQSNVHLTGLPTLPNSLNFINCSDCPLNILPTLPIALDTLICNTNSLTNLPALPSSLIYLDCSQNALASLPSLPNSLLSLTCNNTTIVSLPALPNSLTFLVCNQNHINCFPNFPSSITYLDIIGNPYNCLPNYITAMSGTSYTTTHLCAAGNSNGCAVAGIEQYTINNEVKVYPNPASEVLNVECLMVTESSNITLTDILGNTVKQVPFNTQHVTFNIKDIGEGVYNLSISTKEGVANKRVVIDR